MLQCNFSTIIIKSKILKNNKTVQLGSKENMKGKVRGPKAHLKAKKKNHFNLVF
jgi:hypothetical protein